MSKKTKGSLSAAYVFFFFVGGLILLSLFFRVMFLLEETKFDGSSHFTLEIKNDRTKNIQIISFSPQSSSIGILDLVNLNPRALEVPVDATVQSNFDFNKQNITSNLFKTIADFKNQKEINFIDVFRLFLFSGTVKDSSIIEKSLNSQAEKVNIDSVVSAFFIDSQISNEKLSIEIVNSTNASGLGNRLANYISNMGGNVILVSTGEEKKESEIDYSRDSYTVNKLNSMLNIKKIKMQKKTLPDVIIIIGEDGLGKLNF